MRNRGRPEHSEAGAIHAHYIELLDTKLMIGVGAAFDFRTSRIKDGTTWNKAAGLQWLQRLLPATYLANLSSEAGHAFKPYES
jgi:hypothetical protein